MMVVLVTSDIDIMPSFIFLLDLRLNAEAYIEYAWEVFPLDAEGGCKKIHRLAIEYCTMQHKQENPVLAVRKFLPPHHP